MIAAMPTTEKNQSAEVTESAEKTEIKTEMEKKLENLLESVEGVGKVNVMLMADERDNMYTSGNTEVTGVLIAAEGADNSVTIQQIQQAVMALFQIEAHKIKIMKMK